MQIKIYLKRGKLKEKIIPIPEREIGNHVLRFLLLDELYQIRNKLKVMKSKGIINNISLPRKKESEDLVKSRKSILNALRQLP